MGLFIENFLLAKHYAFAIRLVRLYSYLFEEKKEYVFSKKLPRSGTSVKAMRKKVF